MPASEAQKRATRKWKEANRDSYWRCTIRVPIGEKEKIVNQAAKRGKTVSRFILDLIDEDIAKG